MCRACNNAVETQEHVPEECDKIHNGEQDEHRLSKEQLFSEDPDILKTATRKIQKVLEHLL